MSARGARERSLLPVPQAPRGERDAGRAGSNPGLTKLRLLSWNVAGRSTYLARQAAALARREPDIVCLQEVRASTAPRWRAALESLGLERIADSSDFIGRRRFFNLTASRWATSELPPLGAPQPERVLSLRLDTPVGVIELHNAHVPPSQSQGLTKIETCEALFHQLARPAAHHRVLCGDLNTPQLETTEGELITFAANHPQWLQRWDAAERSLLQGLAPWDLHDQFRRLNGYDRRDVSWVFNTRSRRRSGHRLDHVIASASLNTIACDYEHGWREAGLSDHSAIEAVFDPAG